MVREAEKRKGKGTTKSMKERQALLALEAWESDGVEWSGGGAYHGLSARA